MKEKKFKQTLVQTKEGSRHCEEHSDVAIQDGFKMTEVGMIPSDWNLVEISELAKDMADGPFGSNLKKEHYTSDSQVRIIQLSNIGECGWENENTKYTTFEHAKTIARCIVPKEESILVAKMMPAGRAIICPKTEKQYILGSDVIRITANEKLNSKYFVYATKSQAYLKQISDNTQGSTRQRTSISKLRKIAMPLPIFKEQQRIASALSDIDTLIANIEKLIAKKKNIKQGAMQQLLTGKKRLPGFAPDERTGSRPTDERRKECHSERSAKREVEKSSGYKMTELGLIPSDWLQMKLRDLCYLITKQTGFDYSATIKPSLVTEESKETLPFIQNKDFEGTSINFATDFFIPKNIAANFPKILLNEPVLLISISGKIGNVAYFSHERDAFIGGAVGVARFNEKKYIKWTNLFLQSEYGQKQIFANEKSGAQHNLTIEDVRNLNVYMPSSCEEQTAIANVLSDMDTEISALETKLAKYRKLKTGMMQQLLTGKIRLV